MQRVSVFRLGFHLRHVVVLHCHGNDVDADDGGDCQVEVLAAGDRV